MDERLRFVLLENKDHVERERLARKSGRSVIPDHAAAGDDGVDKADLAVQLKRARLHNERTRRRAPFRSLIDDPDADAKTSQPQC